MFFGVFDGHGEMGTSCSKFAQQQIPRMVQKHLLSGKDDSTAHNRAFIETNLQLHKHPIDDSLSGTTAITVYLNGTNMTVANVGDSRAIIGEYNNGHIISHDLSHDQTPYRPDELIRVRKAGARVQTLDQIEGLKDPDVDCWGTEEGDGGDPPRIWAVRNKVVCNGFISSNV
jgi:serine/threonine protein phosphatase PrpC